MASALMLSRSFLSDNSADEGIVRGKENAMVEVTMDRMMRIPEVVRVTGLSKTTIWRRVKSGDFPAPVRLGSLATRSVGWRESEIREWLDSRPVFAE